MWQLYTCVTVFAMTIKKQERNQKHFKKSSIVVIMFWELMFDQVFLSPQVQRIAIISNKHGIYELPQKLPNDLSLGILGY